MHIMQYTKCVLFLLFTVLLFTESVVFSEKKELNTIKVSITATVTVNWSVLTAIE